MNQKVRYFGVAIITTVMLLMAFSGVAYTVVVNNNGHAVNNKSQAMVKRSSLNATAMLDKDRSKVINSSDIEMDGITFNYTKYSNGYSLAFIQDGGNVYVKVIEISKGVIKYSINNGRWVTFDASTFVTSQVVWPSFHSMRPICISCGGGGNGGGGNHNHFWWYNTFFVKGWPHDYPHPSVSYYHIYTQYDWSRVTDGVWNYQIGSDFAGPLRNGGDTVLGAVIGAAFGAIIGGGVGAAVGAAIGAIIATILDVVTNFIAFDGHNAVWFWTNEGFYNALHNIPWWLILLGPSAIAGWLMGALKYFRVGNYTFKDSDGISNP